MEERGSSFTLTPLPAGGRPSPCHRLAPWPSVIPVELAPTDVGGDSASRLFAMIKERGYPGEVFPHAACVVTLVDRLIHRAEVIDIDAESYRLKEAKELNAARSKQRKKKH